MRAYQVFAVMSPERAEAVLGTLAEQAPETFAQGLAAASVAFRSRPVYLRRLPFERRAEAVRRALARVGANALAEELLAVYFLECRRKLLVEWLDAIGLEHDEGTLKDEAPASPPPEKLREAVKRFRRRRRGSEAADRELLLRAFGAQAAIEWPELEALLDQAG